MRSPLASKLWNLSARKGVSRSIAANGWLYATRCLVLLLLGVAATGHGKEPQHPRLLFEPSDLPRLRRAVESGWMKDAYGVLLQRADGFLLTPTDPYPMSTPQTNGKKTAGRALNNRVSELALAGYLTEDQRYTDKAIEIVLAAARQTSVADFESWNGHLAVGDAGHAYAMAYDWLWPHLDAPQRELLRAEIQEFGEWLYRDSMTGRGYGAYEVTPLSCNHNAVLHGGLGLCGLVLGGQPEWVDRAAKYVRGYLQNARDKTGYNYEGVGYYGYGSWGAIPFTVALQRAGGRDLLRGVRSARRVPDYLLRQLIPWGGEMVAMNDSPPRLGAAGGLMHLLARYQDRVGLWAWLRMQGEAGDGHYGADPRGALGGGASLPYVLLMADPDLKPQRPDDAGVSLNAFFRSGRASFRSGWDDLDALATFTCGYEPHRGHNHRDENSFTFFARGERFAIDPGYNPSATRHHNTVLVNGLGQDRADDEYDVHGRTERMLRSDRGWSIAGDAAPAFVDAAKVVRARRELLFVNAETPYLVIADDLLTDNEGVNEYAWLLHTDPTNRIEIGEEPGTAYLIGSRREAVCLVRFVGPIEAGDGLQVTETDLSNETFVRSGRTLKHASYYRELRAVNRAERGRFVAVVTAADSRDQLPQIEWKGRPDNLWIEVRGANGRIDRIRVTPKAIELKRTLRGPDRQAATGGPGRVGKA